MQYLMHEMTVGFLRVLCWFAVEFEVNILFVCLNPQSDETIDRGSYRQSRSLNNIGEDTVSDSNHLIFINENIAMDGSSSNHEIIER